MNNQVAAAARDQIRGITGALLVVGLTFHYTMETWWLGWTLPMQYLLGFALVGLAVVVAITRFVGFHRDDQGQSNGQGQDGGQGQGGRRGSKWMVVDSTQIVLQSFVAAYVILLVLGIIDLDSSLDVVVRLGLVEVVPLAFGAAMANRLFGSTSEQEAEKEMQFPQNLALFAIGAMFIASTMAPTQEMELISAHMDWPRHLSLIVLTLVLVYLILYELDFEGQRGRTRDDWRLELATVFVVYFVGATSSLLLLTGLGHFSNATHALIYQEMVVLAFPASLGAAGAQVVV